MSLTLSAAAITDLGPVRTNNEDSAHAGHRLIAVADGVAGLPAGELASDIVIRTLATLEEESDAHRPLPQLREALDAANQQIREAAAADPAHEGMGTTLTAMLLAGDQLALLHVGDSRGYRFRDGALAQLTKDDTYVQSLVDQGMLTPEEARDHPQRSLVTQVVQGQHLTPTCAVLTPHPGDRYVLCSDGLSDAIPDDAIASALGSYPDPHECAACLVKLALQAGARDNVTVVVADVVTA